MSKNNTIKLTESDLKRVITESVKRVLKESNYNNPQDPVSLLTDIIGRYATKEDRNDYEIQGQSGRYYRFIVNRDYVTVMWATEPYEWDEGEEFMLRMNEPFVKSLIHYIIDSAK